MSRFTDYEGFVEKFKTKLTAAGYKVFGNCILLGEHVAEHLRTERERTERERTDFFILSPAEAEEVAKLTKR